jgi:hypothetical protein
MYTLGLFKNLKFPIFSVLAGSYLENKKPLLVTGVQVVITDTSPKVC